MVSCDSGFQRNPDHIAYVDSIQELALRNFDKNPDAAKAFFDSAYNLIDRPGVGAQIRKYAFLGGKYYLERKDYPNAIAYLDSIPLTLATEELKQKYMLEYVMAIFRKGDVLFEYKKYHEAYQHYYRGKMMAETVLDRCVQSQYTYRLGMVSYKQGKFVDAASNFKQCFEDASFCQPDFTNFALRQEVLSNTALSYARAGMLDSAVYYSKAALAYIRENEKVYPDRKEYLARAKGVVYGNQADLYTKTGRTAIAEDLLKKSIAINSQPGFDNHDAQVSLLKLGNLYLETNQLANVRVVAESLATSLDTIKSLVVEARLHKLNWGYYDRLQQPDRAYKYLREYMLLNDSLERANKDLVTADVYKEFERIEQQYQYNLLSKENELKKVYLYIAILVAVMILVILLLLVRNWQTTRRNVAELTRLNKQETFQNMQLEQATADLREINDNKDRILKVVAHDLRNPIGAIGTIAMLLLQEAQLSKEHAELVELAQESSQHAIKMINDLLTTNLNNRPADMKKEWVDVQALIYQCVDTLRFKAEEKHQRIELILDEPVRLLVDREKVWRVLSNLLTNAIKFSPTEGVIRLKAEQIDQTFRLTVQDAGIGIPEHLKEKVFQAFSEAKRKGTHGEPSFGLGLSFSKQIIEAHQGVIWFESEPGQGTTFYIELPAEPQAVEAASTATYNS
ncbi:hypothetical protein GCM10027275_32130 [Rhabdobacter roseus]|uniref:histidine kinase n=1 Tax=Rhabdobacter roseus TaxID=1655419 RepID=A0A840TUC9_9BACT|nr:tetratricopeptide repeat-containing sensor histidine kinase [Rhabdobacter roseus]MBB5285172.1 signal transduction histidine kinase [Rhabdobacter roseus]